jgi:predicted AAA+ superfamily ATPase
LDGDPLSRPDPGAVVARLQQLLDRLEAILPAPASGPDGSALAYRWDARRGLVPVAHPQRVDPADLLHLERQRRALERNTERFVAGLPCNNALLWGARGTGKSSLVKSLLTPFAERGLRLIEVDRHELTRLPEIVEPLHGRSERFVVFADDLSFDADDPAFRALKAVLDGSIAAPPDNVVVYATSNRRHLMPEFLRENLEVQRQDEEIHPGEAVEEKIALSDRFGLWLSFPPFTQDQYLAVVAHWMARLGAGPLTDEIRQAALRWALARGTRSGRTARQFVLAHLAGA